MSKSSELRRELRLEWIFACKHAQRTIRREVDLARSNGHSPWPMGTSALDYGAMFRLLCWEYKTSFLPADFGRSDVCFPFPSGQL